MIRHLENKGYAVRSWWFLLASAILPIFLLSFFTYKWYQQRADLKRISEYFVERQNRMLANDAEEIATGISDLLEKAARDVQVLELIPPVEKSFLKFTQSQSGEFTHFVNSESSGISENLPFYNRVAFVSSNGRFGPHVYKGLAASSPSTVKDCHEKDLCDRALLEKVLGSPPGSLEYGSIMRWYSPKGSIADDSGSALHIAYRTLNGALVLGIDYRHVRDHMTIPTFPYYPKRNLIQAYDNGNYIYVLDSFTRMIAHPKSWHEFGLDRATGLPVSPMRTDNDEGTHPVQVAAYTEGRLKPYFDRLLKKSFPSKKVDLFRAANLEGTTRVLSVAPILLDSRKFKQRGVFGYVVVGCNVDYFEEPKEKAVPYY